MKELSYLDKEVYLQTRLITMNRLI